MKKFVKIAIVTLLGVHFGDGTWANTLECEYTNWRGAETKSVAISWVGVGFLVDPSRGIVQVKVPGGYYEELKADVVRSANFDGYVIFRNEKTVTGEVYRIRYSFRVYKSGKCEGWLGQGRFMPLVGEGRIK
jgi:hypothetical protein